MVEEIKLDFYSGYTATYIFLENLWDHLQETISDKDKEDFGALMGVAYGNPSWETDWEDALEKFYGRKINRSSQIFSRDLFKVFIIFVTIFHEKFGYPCPFLLELLNGMEKSPNQFKNEWGLWKAAARDASSGNYNNFGQG